MLEVKQTTVHRALLDASSKPYYFPANFSTSKVALQTPTWGVSKPPMPSLRHFLVLTFIIPLTIAASCPCGWRLKDSDQQFTHRLYNDFSKYPGIRDVVGNPTFNSQWIVNGFPVPSDDAAIRLDKQFHTENIELRNGYLVLKQRGYTEADQRVRNPVSVAGIQSRELEILHGSFRAVMKIEGANGGAVGSFFWLHNDTSEIDIEAVTQGTSFVNGTINYTSHPSTWSNGTAIRNATRSVPMPQGDEFLASFRSYRFDCHPITGNKWYLDDDLVHQDSHNIPRHGGSVQLHLWADGNKWWSGIPSSTNVFMTVKEILMYYNTTGTYNDSDMRWFDKCRKAGGPNDRTVCLEGTRLDEDNHDIPDMLVPPLGAAPSSAGGSEGRIYLSIYTLFTFLSAITFAFALL